MINKLLLIDDDEIAAFLMGKLVNKNHLVNKFVVKENGKEGLDYLRALEAQDEFPQVIFVDLDMPVLNGYEFLDAYQQEFWPKHSDTQVVMLTSSRRKLDWDNAMKYECLVDFIFKPATTQYLEQLMVNSAVG